MAQAVSALEAQRRWVLTGTPIVCFFAVVQDAMLILLRQINSPQVGDIFMLLHRS